MVNIRDFCLVAWDEFFFFFFFNRQIPNLINFENKNNDSQVASCNLILNVPLNIVNHPSIVLHLKYGKTVHFFTFLYNSSPSRINKPKISELAWYCSSDEMRYCSKNSKSRWPFLFIFMLHDYNTLINLEAKFKLEHLLFEIVFFVLRYLGSKFEFSVMHNSLKRNSATNQNWEVKFLQVLQFLIYWSNCAEYWFDRKFKKLIGLLKCSCHI